MPASEKTALEAVMEADTERVKLEALAEELATMEDEESQDYLMEVKISLKLSRDTQQEQLMTLRRQSPAKCQSVLQYQ